MWTITTLEDLHSLYGEPAPASLSKVADRLTPLYTRWIEASRFCIVSTVADEGTDASPRGDDGPVVRIADPKTILIPDWRGNNRLDTLRNIVRDRYVFELSDGHGAAAAMHIPAAKRPAVPAELSAIGVSRTPLWVYCMQEAEQFGHGKLTGVGGRMVATVFRNLLLRDASSFWHMVPGFEPWHGFRGHGSVLAGIVDFVESRWDGLPQDLRDALKSG